MNTNMDLDNYWCGHFGLAMFFFQDHNVI
jgi:hypothetical protein